MSDKQRRYAPAAVGVCGYHDATLAGAVLWRCTLAHVSTYHDAYTAYTVSDKAYRNRFVSIRYDTIPMTTVQRKKVSRLLPVGSACRVSRSLTCLRVAVYTLYYDTTL
jgi:hypothetical protein